MSNSFFRRLLPASLMLAMMAGCSSTPDISPSLLAQHDWTLVDATDADGHLDASLQGGEKPPVLLTFQEQRLGVRNACNNMGGDYKLSSDKLEVGNLMQTMMACESELMARESAIKTRLQEPLRVQYDAATSRLTLINDAGVMVFEPVDK
ncbi:MAG: META domain-containing protein [Pseudomonadaceae bacterium]|nr:META domain-containing protein [Pseudomonadaceae bacterium]